MEQTVNPVTMQAMAHAIPLLVAFPSTRFWVDYDKEADVLSMSFERPQKATETEMTDDGLLLRYRQKQLVGMTVLEASTRATT